MAQNNLLIKQLLAGYQRFAQKRLYDILNAIASDLKDTDQTITALTQKIAAIISVTGGAGLTHGQVMKRISSRV
jgi:hypothetical protein